MTTFLFSIADLQLQSRAFRRTSFIKKYILMKILPSRRLALRSTNNLRYAPSEGQLPLAFGWIRPLETVQSTPFKNVRMNTIAMDHSVQKTNVEDGFDLSSRAVSCGTEDW